jgi:hypothetical protein
MTCLDIDRLLYYVQVIGIADERSKQCRSRCLVDWLLTTDVLAGVGRRTKGRCDFAPAFFVVGRDQAGRTFSALDFPAILTEFVADFLAVAQ